MVHISCDRLPRGSSGPDDEDIRVRFRALDALVGEARQDCRRRRGQSAWLELVSTELPDNVDLQLARSEDEYANSIAARGTRFDVVVIDGSARNLCAKACVEYLAPDGVIVWDNSEMPAIFDEGLDFLRERGFHRIDFYGLGPLNMDPWATSVLYRPGTNSFHI